MKQLTKMESTGAYVLHVVSIVPDVIMDNILGVVDNLKKGERMQVEVRIEAPSHTLTVETEVFGHNTK